MSRNQTTGAGSRENLNFGWRRGFTLVELLIAMALLTLLMAGLWSMFGVYARVLEKSERRATRVQLTRSLQDQLRTDLRAALVTIESNVEIDEASIDTASSTSLLPSNGTNKPFDAEDSVTQSSDDDSFQDGYDSSEGMQTTLAFEITDENWHDAELEFFGNSHGLILQSRFVESATIPGHDLEQSEHQLGFANPTPESVKRTIYFYLDPEDARTHGYPSGLFRMEFSNAQLHSLPDQMDSDLFGLLEILKPEFFFEPENGMLQSKEPFEEQELIPTELSEHQLREEENRLKNLQRKIDFVPEVKAFRLRYYDGRSWASRWDARGANGLPVAVEVSFEIEDAIEEDEPEVRGEMDAVDAAILQKEQDEQSAIDDQAGMAMDLDDEVRSSQTMDISPPNRFVIFVRPPENRFLDDEDTDFDETGDVDSRGSR